MKSRLWRIQTLIACLMLFSSITVIGQVIKGSISGSAVDPQGAVISGAQIKATDSQTGAVFNTTSDGAGLFRFNLIPAGEYKVEVSAQGFKTSVQGGIVVVAGHDSGIGTIQLSVGEANTTVEVLDTAPLVDTTQSQVTNTFAGTQLSNFPGIQENQGLDNLALFVPGVTNTRDNTFSNQNGAGFSVNGLRGRNNDQEIDGQNNNDNSVGGASLLVSDTEFVGQYVLVSSQFGPEYGRNSGSIVNIITKGGGNAWRGSIYANESNSILNSLTNQQKNFESDFSGNPLTKVPRFNSEFGGFTIGGPIVKNKAFLFGGFDQQIVSQGTIYSATLLTPTPAGLAQLNSCFPASVSLQAFNKFGPYANSTGNPIPLGAPTAMDVGTCTGVPFAGIERQLPTPQHAFNFVVKQDLLLGGDTITSRYLFNRNNFFNQDTGSDNAVLGYPVNIPALSQAILESWTHNFSTRIVNEARVSFNRLNVDFGGNTIGNTVPTSNGLANAVAQGTIQATGFLGLFGTSNVFPQSRLVNTWQAQDNWTYVLGKHQLKSGVNWTYQRSPNTFLPNLNGTYRFSSWTSFINNTPNRVRVAQGTPVLDFREYDTFAYAGDDWKIAKNLTLNLGLTWTYYGQPENLFHTLTTKQQTGANPFWNPALPASVTTSPTIPTVMNSFGPSFGFAYSPQWGGFLTGHGKTTIRGGFRLLYDPSFGNIYLNESSSAPNVFLQSFTGAKAITKALPLVPTGPNVRASLAPFLTTGVLDPRTQNVTNVSPNFGSDKVNEWNFGVERELSKNSAFEARYVGNHAYDLFQSINANPLISQLQADFPSLVPSNLTPCAATQQVGTGAGTDVGRLHCGQGVVRTRDNGGYSNYEAVQLEFRANNMFKQLTMRAGYTHSKTLDNVSEIFNTFGGGNSVAFAQNPLNTTRSEYSFSGLDIPNQFTVIFTEELPFFKEQHGVLGHILGGWAVSPSFVFASGQRYTPTQEFTATFSNPGATGGSNAPGDYYDVAFWGAFSGVEPARPFIGNLSAPQTAVGIFAGDACNVFGAGCALAPTQLISMNQVNSSGNAVSVTKNQVRFIMNGFTAQQIFGTPFGNAPRSIAQDARTNLVNLGITKRFKISEHNSFEFRTTMLNAFNHPNFSSVDTFLEDAGNNGFFNGFGNPSLTNSVTNTNTFGTRQILFGGVFRF